MWLWFSYCDIKMHLLYSGYGVTRSFWPSLLEDIVFWMVQPRNNTKGPVQSRQKHSWIFLERHPVLKNPPNQTCRATGCYGSWCRLKQRVPQTHIQLTLTMCAYRNVYYYTWTDTERVFAYITLTLYNIRTLDEAILKLRVSVFNVHMHMYVMCTTYLSKIKAYFFLQTVVH